MQLLNYHEFHLSPAFRTDVAEHFLFIHGMALHDEDKSADQGPSYITIKHDAGDIIVPVVNAVAMVSLPSKIQFQHFKNGKVRAASN